MLQLGCLPGQYDKAQSFDVASAAIGTSVESWSKVSEQPPFYYDALPLRVHSSDQGLRMEVFSSAGSSVLRYIHGKDDDAHVRWFPAATTHQAGVRPWAAAAAAASSGVLKARLIVRAAGVLRRCPSPGDSNRN